MGAYSRKVRRSHRAEGATRHATRSALHPAASAATLLFTRQARRESNPQPPVLETGALPIELRTYEWPGTESNCRHHDFQSCALPTELPGRKPGAINQLPCETKPRTEARGLGEIAGAGFEPATSGL